MVKRWFVAWAISDSIFVEAFIEPFSMRAIVDCGLPIKLANSRWLNPIFARRSRTFTATSKLIFSCSTICANSGFFLLRSATYASSFALILKKWTIFIQSVK